MDEVGGVPVLVVPFAPFSLLGALLPTVWFNPGMTWQWDWRNKVYQRLGSETIAIVPFLLGRPSLYTSSMEVSKQILSLKNPFEKPSDATQAVSQFGPNIFTSNGVEWRRHIRILSPGFNNGTYAMVWEETATIYEEIIVAEGWSSKSSIDIPAVKVYTNKLALLILSRCGFGHYLPWNAPPTSAEKLNFLEALETVTDKCMIRLIVPRWMYKLPIPSLHKIETAYRTLEESMHELLHSSRETLKTEDMFTSKRDVFSVMVRANQSDEGRFTMTDQELIGNTFFLLFAGHETVAHLLNATLGYLALYQDIQDTMYDEISSIAPGNVPITYSMFPKLKKTLSCFLESGRLFPPGFILMREAVADTILLTNVETTRNQVYVKNGTRIAVDMVGLHYNPRHFPDPEEFRPSRWYEASDTDISFFSVGPRACTGRKFAMVEACCLLAHLLRDWKLDIINRSGETREQWRKRIMRVHAVMTMGVGDVPVRLTRRV